MTALYIHIPFCKKKCNYCDFVSYAGKEELIDDYVKKLCEELQSSPPSVPLSIEDGEGETRRRREGVRCIFIGGGTPTLLDPNHYEKLFTNYDLRITNYEITIEANPGTANKAKLKRLRQLGANRLSIGAQSFNNLHLKTLGRIHNSKEIFRIYNDARAVGFENINLDLIFALPGQTLEEWKSDLKTAISLEPNHISAYNLIIEEGTNFFDVISKSQAPKSKQYQNPNFQLPNEDQELAMYEYTIDALTANGYRHYEISNFAKPGYECQHNINYWKNGNYIGIGAGAHSHINGKRWSNPASVEEYIGCGGATRNVTRQTLDDSSRATDQRETIFLGLRLLEGLSTDKFKGFEKEVDELIKDGLLTQENGNYKLSRQGLYLGNEVFAKFV